MAASKRDPDLRLIAFRIAAWQVRETGPITSGARIHFSAGQEAGAAYEERATLLDPDGFRSLAMAVRNVYLAKNPANFPRVCQTLKHRLAADQHRAVDRIRNRYDAILNRSGTLFEGPVNGKLRRFSARAVFDTWINARGFHYAPQVQAEHDALSAQGLYFPFVLQGIVLRLAGCVLDLDDVVADALGGTRLPRISSREA